MKWLSAGLTFVNLATILGLVLGIVGHGLNAPIAITSLILGAAAGVLAYVRTTDPKPKTDDLECATPAAQLFKHTPNQLEFGYELPPQPQLHTKYRHVWKWILAACFVIFAVRSFCWLLYIEGDQLKIQSPNNLGDLALHITHIRYFANSVPLWPANPIYVFSQHLRYPAGADLFNALLSCMGVDLIRGLVWTGLIASLATFYAFYRWGGPFGVAGFLFNGGIAGFAFFNRLQFLDYQGDKTIAWKSIPLSMFVTQRGWLYAIPAGLLLLWHWREKFFRGAAHDRVAAATAPLPFWVELSLYASMPLFHLHTFLALTIVLVFVFVVECPVELKFIVDLARQERLAGMRSLILKPSRWRDFFGHARMQRHVLALVAAAFVPATFLVWLITDHFRARSVLMWYPGWVLHEKYNNDFGRPFFEFWFVNFGILIPLVLALIGLCIWRLWRNGFRWTDKASEEIVFLFTAIVIFLVGLLFKLAPWEWDNLKLMVWAYFLVLPFLWTHLVARWEWPVRAAVCFALFASGFVSLFGGLTPGGFGFADRAELDGVGLALQKLPVEARFAAYPTYNHPLLLQGRKVALGYPGHLWTQGFADYNIALGWLNEMMQGADSWLDTARRLHVRYIFWGHEEIMNYPTSKRPWERTAALVASGGWGAIYDAENEKR